MGPIPGELLTIKMPAKAPTNAAPVDEVPGSFAKSLSDTGLIPVLQPVPKHENVAEAGQATHLLKAKLPLLTEGAISKEQTKEAEAIKIPAEDPKQVVEKDGQTIPIVPSKEKPTLPEEVAAELGKDSRHQAIAGGAALEIGKKIEKKDQKLHPATVASDHKTSEGKTTDLQITVAKTDVQHLQAPTEPIAHGKELAPVPQVVSPAKEQSITQMDASLDAKNQRTQPYVEATTMGTTQEASRGTSTLDRKIADSRSDLESTNSRTALGKSPIVPGIEKKDKASGLETVPGKSEELVSGIGIAVPASHPADSSRQDGGMTAITGEHIVPLATVRHEPEIASSLSSGKPEVSGYGDGHNSVRDGSRDAIRERGPELIAATPTALEVGMSGGAHGWLKVRAELEDGVVTASLSAATETGREALHRELPSIAAYLQDEKVGVGTLVVKEASSSNMGQLFDGSGPGTQGQGPHERPNLERQENGATLRSSDGVWNTTDDEKVYEPSSTSTGLLAPIAGSSGSWLNVRA